MTDQTHNFSWRRFSRRWLQGSLLYFGFCITLYSLASGQFPSGVWLYVTYFGYAAFALASVHWLCFLLNGYLRGIRSAHRKRVPKYLEYAYVGLLSVGLVQIFFSSARISDYVAFVAGDEATIIEQIRRISEGYLEGGCKKNDREFFTIEYCRKIKEIVYASDLKEHLLNVTLKDDAFLDHRVERRMLYTEIPIFVKIRSEIFHLTKKLQAWWEYSGHGVNHSSGNVFGWFAMLLLPIGIALRTAKTSLELFGDLDADTARKAV